MITVKPTTPRPTCPDNAVPIYIVCHGVSHLIVDSLSGYRHPRGHVDARYRPWICEAYVFNPVFTKRGKLNLRKSGRVCNQPDESHRITWRISPEDVYLTRETAEAAIAPMLVEYETYLAKMKALQKACMAVTLPMFDELEALADEFPPLPGNEPRIYRSLPARDTCIPEVCFRLTGEEWKVWRTLPNAPKGFVSEPFFIWKMTALRYSQTFTYTTEIPLCPLHEEFDIPEFVEYLKPRIDVLTAQLRELRERLSAETP